MKIDIVISMLCSGVVEVDLTSPDEAVFTPKVITNPLVSHITPAPDGKEMLVQLAVERVKAMASLAIAEESAKIIKRMIDEQGGEVTKIEFPVRKDDDEDEGSNLN